MPTKIHTYSIPEYMISWIVEFVESDYSGFTYGCDVVQGKSVLDAKRNLIAKTGLDNIKFLSVERYYGRNYA